MNIFIFCLTILAGYGIIRKAYMEWIKSDVRDKMDENNNFHELKREIKEYKKTHRDKPSKSRKIIEDFKKE